MWSANATSHPSGSSLRYRIAKGAAAVPCLLMSDGRIFALGSVSPALAMFRKVPTFLATSARSSVSSVPQGISGAGERLHVKLSGTQRPPGCHDEPHAE